MKTRLLYLIFAFMIIVPVNSYSQVGGVLRRAVNRQINREVDSLLDKKVQDEQNKNRARKAEQQAAEQESRQADAAQDADQTEQADNANTNSNADGAAFGALFGNKITLKYNDEYKFTSRIYMVTETYDGNEIMKIDFFMFTSANSPVVGVETNTLSDDKNSAPMLAKMVMDGENKTMLMLTDINGMKMGMISEIPDENTIIGPDGKTVKDYTPPVFTKTGNTRTIAGYKCDEYTYTNAGDKTSGRIWFTKDVKLSIDRRGWNNSGMSYYYGSNQFNDGIILANEAYDSKGKIEMKSETKEINENFPHSISASGYTLRQMNMKKK